MYLAFFVHLWLDAELFYWDSALKTLENVNIGIYQATQRKINNEVFTHTKFLKLFHSSLYQITVEVTKINKMNSENKQNNKYMFISSIPRSQGRAYFYSFSKIKEYK